MSEYREISETLDVPIGTGVDGFLKVIGEILRLRRVQEVKIDARGKVSYLRYAREGEPDKPLDVDLETLMPYAVLRNNKLQELPVADDAAHAVGQLFHAAGQDGLFPIAFIGGTNSMFFKWYKQTTGIELKDDNVYGLPFLVDRKIEDYMLFLAAGYARYNHLADLQKAYKIVIPQGKP
jgi:hypothetical protein